MVLKQLVEHHSSANVKDYCELQCKKDFRVYSRSSFFALQFIGRQEMTEMKLRGIEVIAYLP